MTHAVTPLLIAKSEPVALKLVVLSSFAKSIEANSQRSKPQIALGTFASEETTLGC